MSKSYWVQYRYKPTDTWITLSEFVNISLEGEFITLEQWWVNESRSCEHELLQVVKL
ncbi:conserved hypothetical protein [Vibrio phage 424E50-1]|nr:conserved hypothetical protein [Vibrio phage 424E50-1]